MNNQVPENQSTDQNLNESIERNSDHEHDEASKQRRKKRRKNKVRKHSPQYYQQRKAAKLNKRKQNEWNNRFVLESMPLRSEVLDKIKFHKKGMTRNQPRDLSPKQGAKVYRTFNPGENKNKNGPSKSFNIRVVSKKQNTNNLTQSENKKQNKQQSEKQKLITALEQTFTELQFNQGHFQILKDIIKNSKSKSLSNYIEAEISAIKQASSSSSNVQKAIADRKNSIQQLSLIGTGTDEVNKKQKITNYQLLTLKVIEEVLKWKEQMEKVFKEHTQMKTKLAYRKDGENYVTQMGSHVKFMGPEEYQDVFLLSLCEGKISRELIVKVRACETLILEEMLEDGK